MVAQLDRTFLRIAPGRAASRLVGYSMFEGRPATTRGRWWNPVVFGNLRLAARGADAHVDRPLFIVGMGRSGTTLLGRILAAHPSVGFLNEPKALWHVIRADEDIIGSYDAQRTGRLHLGAEDADEEVRRRGRALFAWYLRASRSQRLLDKYPELVFRHSFVRAIFPDARFIVAVRSPWATLRSVVGWSESYSVGGADWWGVQDRKWDALWRQGVLQRAENCDLACLDLGGEVSHHIRAAVEWVIAMREAISLAGLDDRAQFVRYEDLVANPREVVGETLRFCELPASPRTESYAAATVSPTGDRDGNRSAALSHLPELLAHAVEETWSRLETVEQALSVSRR